MKLRHAEMRFDDDGVTHLVQFDLDSEEVVVSSSTNEPNVKFRNPPPRRYRPCVKHCAYLIARAQLVLLDQKAAAELKELYADREIPGRS